MTSPNKPLLHLTTLTLPAFYNSSKAAVRAYSETLRLELAPLGVKVITVMAGIVGTNIFSNHPEAHLSDTSPWKPAEDVIIAQAGGSMIDGAMPRSVFAGKIVRDVLGGKTGLTWTGKMSSVAWWLVTCAPMWLMVCSALFSGTGLGMIVLILSGLGSHLGVVGGTGSYGLTCVLSFPSKAWTYAMISTDLEQLS